jgi:hypothetical protein
MLLKLWISPGVLDDYLESTVSDPDNYTYKHYVPSLVSVLWNSTIKEHAIERNSCDGQLEFDSIASKKWKEHNVCMCNCQDQRLLIQDNHRELQDSWGEDVITLEDKKIGQHPELSGLRHFISTVLKAYLKAEMGRKRRQLSKIFGFKEGNAPSHKGKKFQNCQDSVTLLCDSRLKNSIFQPHKRFGTRILFIF